MADRPGGRGPRAQVVVVGGGITGLAAAWYLKDHRDVTLVEAGDRVGGKIMTTERWVVPVEAGPDLFLARVPWAVDLCREAGLGDDLITPATSRAFLWTRGGLWALPSGLMMGIPTRLGPVVRSRIVPASALARAALDAVLPARSLPPDPSVADVIGARFGNTVLDQLVEPLLGGIHAGRTDRLSLRAVAPEVASLAAGSRSLLLGARRRESRPRSMPPAGPSDGPVFQSLRGGVQKLVDRLAADLGPRIMTGTSVRSLRPWAEGGLAVDVGGTMLGADAVVITTPAGPTATMVRSASASAAWELGSVRYASVATVTLAYERSSIGHPLDGSGFLVPPVDGRLLTACTFLTSKWPALKGCGLVLLRASCGRVDDDRPAGLDDEDLAGAVHRELAEALGIRARPVDSVVARWPDALPQYEPGHQARIGRAKEALATDLPGTRLAGAAYGGLGIAACVRQAREAADACLALSR